MKVEGRAEEIRRMFPAGTRIVLYDMVGERNYGYGDKGTVTSVDDIGQIHMKWDKGGSLALNPFEDSFGVIK